MLRAFCDAVEQRNGRAFADLNFAPERIAKIVGKQGAELKARPEMKRHLV